MFIYEITIAHLLTFFKYLLLWSNVKKKSIIFKFYGKDCSD
jgi:hypothetical protein